MKSRVLFVFLLVLQFSCSHKNKIPEFLSEKVSTENLIVLESFQSANTTLLTDSVFSEKPGLFVELENQQKLFSNKDELFNLETCENSWNNFKQNSNISALNSAQLKSWFEICGFLFQLTENTKYMEEMEKVSLHFPSAYSTEIDELIAPFVYTKNVDHIHVNLFHPVEINYAHTLKGDVKIWQETDYPKSGSVQLNFSLSERRYIEIFVRIPEWAEGATVAVKKVKYLAPPGGYCKIVKKWKEGDIVEIEFPTEKIPEDYRKTSN